MNTVEISNSIENTHQIAIEFSKNIKKGDIIILDGELGVGKTEFIKAICSFFGVAQLITSPSFTIINQYECNRFDTNITIFHIDLYRIKNKNELFEMGFQELLFTQNSIKFIEWAENSFGTIPHFNHRIKITASTQNETSRTIEIESIDM